MSKIEKEIESDALENVEIVCVFDGYEPRLAPLVLETIQGMRDEAIFTVMFNLLCDEAYKRTCWN